MKITGSSVMDQAIVNSQCWENMRRLLNDMVTDPNTPPEFVRIASMQLSQMQCIEVVTIDSIKASMEKSQ